VRSKGRGREGGKEGKKRGGIWHTRRRRSINPPRKGRIQCATTIRTSAGPIGRGGVGSTFVGAGGSEGKSQAVDKKEGLSEYTLETEVSLKKRIEIGDRKKKQLQRGREGMGRVRKLRTEKETGMTFAVGGSGVRGVGSLCSTAWGEVRKNSEGW